MEAVEGKEEVSFKKSGDELGLGMWRVEVGGWGLGLGLRG